MVTYRFEINEDKVFLLKSLNGPSRQWFDRSRRNDIHFWNMAGNTTQNNSLSEIYIMYDYIVERIKSSSESMECPSNKRNKEYEFTEWEAKYNVFFTSVM